jgi:FkbM family methyltransferase
MNRLTKMLKKKNYTPRHVCEVGVWHPRTSNIKYFIEKNIKSLLIEPDPESIALIKKEWGERKNLTLKTIACTDFEGTIDLHKAGSSSFVSSTKNSPAMVNDSFDIKKNISTKVDAKKFSSEDPGDIDLISIDIEGSEWFVIKHMLSRPDIISIETHGGYYINPHIEDIRKWMDEYNYVLWFKDNSDSVYVKKNIIKVKFNEILFLMLKNIHLVFRRYRKGLKLFFRNL